MGYIHTEFSKELSDLLIKHKKKFTSDKSGIYVVDEPSIAGVIIYIAETASEDIRDKLITVIK